MMPEGRSTGMGREFSPNTGMMLKLSLGVALLAVASFALAYAETISVDVNGGSYDIEYTAEGVTVDSVSAELDITSLVFSVTADTEGTFMVTFDRSFFDSQVDGLDDDFIVLVDGGEPNISSEDGPDSRTLTITIPAGTEEVEIIGSVFADSAPVDDGETDTPAPVDPAPRDPPQNDVPSEQCGPGTVLVGGQCVPDASCGPGTVLKGGQCVPDMTCGPGTVLVGGQCIIDESARPAPTIKSLGKDLGIGFFAAFAAAGVVGIILGIVAKASRSRD